MGVLADEKEEVDALSNRRSRLMARDIATVA